jgi:putative ABC transport system permease protein
MRNVIQDLRYGLRLLRKSPAFTILAMFIIGVGIGANTAIYTLIDQALLRSLPVKESNQLALLRYSGVNNGSSYSRNDDHLYFSYPMYRDLRDRNSVLAGLIATSWAEVGVEWHNQPEMADAELVSGNYFDVLGVEAALGRLIVASDDLAQGAGPVVVLSFTYWQRRFGSDVKILNQNISINGHPFTVIGVTHSGFHSVVAGDNPAVFVPMMMKAEITPGWNDLEERKSTWLNIMGRLKAGVSREQAQAGIDPLWYSIRAEELKQRSHSSQRFRDAFLTNSHLFFDDGSKGVPLHGTVVTTLLIVMAMAGLLALMLCANIAGLLLVRVARRTREISVRYALGAERTRLVQQLLVEGMMLGLAGGALGIVWATPISKILLRTIADPQARHLPVNVHPDLPVLAFNFALTLLVSVLFSLVPALQCWRPDLIEALKQQASVVAGGQIYLRRTSVVGQIAISLLLLVGAGLFIRTLHNLTRVPLGFTTDHLVTFSVNPKLAGYAESQATSLYQQILEKLAGTPGVGSAAATNDPELGNSNWSNNITIAGYRPAEGEDMNVEWARVSAGYFSTMKIPLLVGREIEVEGRAGGQKVAVVNESFAKRYFARPQDALGHYFCSGAGDVKPDIEIVGVVEDAKHTNIREKLQPAIFTPYLQDEQFARFGRFGLTFYVRTWQAPEAAEATIAAAIHSLDSKLVLSEFRTMREQVEQNVTADHAIAFLATSFGALAAVMAAIGTYGVLAYSTAQRTREIGIRVALGARRVEIVGLILKEAFLLAGIGMAAGLPLALLFAGAIRSELFGISHYDPLTLITVCGAIVMVALFSAAGPAYRAAKVDPLVALRYE